LINKFIVENADHLTELFLNFEAVLLLKKFVHVKVRFNFELLLRERFLQ